MTIEDLSFRLSVGGKMHRQRREQANEDSAMAIRRVEARLVEALGGEIIRGMPSLVPASCPQQFHALRVLSNSLMTQVQDIPAGDREVLVLTHRGKLRFARRSAYDGGVITREPNDEELRADVLEAYTRTVQEALEAHLVRTQERDVHYEKVSELAERISSVIGASFR